MECNANEPKRDNNAVIEVIELLKDMPEARQAYLSGIAAGMAAERRLSQADTDTRSA